MNRTILVFIFIIFLKSIQAQTGELNLNTEVAIKKTEYYNFFLYKSDSLVRSIRLSNVGHWKIDSLQKGAYRLNIKEINGSDVLNYYNILVSEDSTTYEDIIIGESISEKKKKEDESNPFEMDLTFLYGNNNNFESQNKKSNNQIYALKIGVSGKDAISKFDQICFYMGGTGSATLFAKDTFTYKGSLIAVKRYTGFCLDFGVYNRFTFYDGQKYANAGMFLDVGINYSLPLYYREIKVVDYQTKIKTKYIHTYTDIYLLTRFGFKFYSLTAEYNISTFLKPQYTEVPKMRFGLTFCLPAS